MYGAGFRAADPGEFTRRAFLNGKIDLTSADGIKKLTEATSHQQWVAARQLAEGRLKTHIEALRQEVVKAQAFMEAQIDFPDEGDTGHLRIEHVIEPVKKLRDSLGRLLSTFSDGKLRPRG